MLKPLADPPTYDAYLNRRKFYWQARKRVQGAALNAEMAMLGRINNKLRGYDWVRAQGHPTLGYDGYPDMETALEMTHLDEFVVKPKIGHSSAGVYLLMRRAGGGYSCSMTGRDYASDAELIAHFERTRRSQGPDDALTEGVIVEDLVRDSFGFDVPLDYKVYAFATGIPLIMQRYAPSHLPKEKWLFEFYDVTGTPLGPVRLETSGNTGGTLRPPDCLDRIVSTARQLVAAAQVSFMRIDMYATPKGPVFGEFTPVPNNAQEGFVPEYDALMGHMWRDSLTELGIDYTPPLTPRSKPASKPKPRRQPPAAPSGFKAPKGPPGPAPIPPNRSG